MTSSPSRVRIVVSPDVPHDIIDTMFYDEGSWHLYNREDHLATADDPSDVAAMLKETEAEFRR